METITEPNKQMTILNSSFRVSLRFEFVLFPIDIIELLEALAKAGYTPMMPPSSMAGSRMLGQAIRISAKGKIAQKGPIEVEMNDELGVIATISPLPELAIQSLNEIVQIIKDQLEVDLTVNALFYEIVGNFEVKTDKNALQSIQQFTGKTSLFESLSKIMNKEVSSFNLRLAPTGQVPSSADWFEITVEPNIIKVKSTYRVIAIYRSKEKVKTEEFAKSEISQIIEIIKTIEA